MVEFLNKASFGIISQNDTVGTVFAHSNMLLLRKNGTHLTKTVFDTFCLDFRR